MFNYICYRIYLAELSQIKPHSFVEYKQLKTKAACERYFEKIVESAVDLTFLLLKERHLAIPEEDKEAFDMLALEGIIPREVAEHLKDAKGMRNLITHSYGGVDDETVYNSIVNELERDVNEFIKHAKKIR